MNILREIVGSTRQALALSVLAALWPLYPVAAETTAAAELPVVIEQANQVEAIQLLDSVALQELVGPIALYPDDLVAIVLPGATYPLQIVQAARFLDALEEDPDLRPDESWDDSVVALLNYPEALKLLDSDLDWTWQLGNAVLNQQDDVVAAIAQFRDRAFTAGNLTSDDKQSVTMEQGAIEITPVDPQVVYVPYYEPAQVVVVQRTPVYYYYPDPYPLYYYPYPAYYSFNSGFFWGVTTAFTIGWYNHNLYVHYPYYPSHRYYSYNYYPHHYLRSHSSHRDHSGSHRYGDNRRHAEGDRWRSSNRAGTRPVRWAGAANTRNNAASVADRQRSRSGEQISASYRTALAEKPSIRRINSDEKGMSRSSDANRRDVYPGRSLSRTSANSDQSGDRQVSAARPFNTRSANRDTHTGPSDAGRLETRRSSQANALAPRNLQSDRRQTKARENNARVVNKSESGVRKVSERTTYSEGGAGATASSNRNASTQRSVVRTVRPREVVRSTPAAAYAPTPASVVQRQQAPSKVTPVIAPTPADSRTSTVTAKAAEAGRGYSAENRSSIRNMSRGREN